MISLIKAFYIIMIVKFIIHLFCYYHVYVDISDYIMQNSILKYVAAKSRQAGKHTDIKLHIHMHVCMHTQTHRHTDTQTHTHTYLLHHMHTKQSKSKAHSSHTKHSYCHPTNQHWDACAPLRLLSLVQANPPGGGLVTHRRTVQV